MTTNYLVCNIEVTKKACKAKRFWKNNASLCGIPQTSAY